MRFLPHYISMKVIIQDYQNYLTDINGMDILTCMQRMVSMNSRISVQTYEGNNQYFYFALSQCLGIMVADLAPECLMANR